MVTMKKRSMVLGMLGAIASFAITTPVLAAERMIWSIEWENKTYDIELSTTAVERFAQTGDTSDFPPEFSYLRLTPEFKEYLREQLNTQITNESNLPLQKLKDLMKILLPKSTEEEQQAAIKLMVQKANGKTAINFLKELPVNTITPDNFWGLLNTYEGTPSPDPSANPTKNILYLNSTRGIGTGNLGAFRKPIADAIDNYYDGTIFDVDFIQTHVPGSLASWLNSKPVGYYNQIWFDTTIYQTSLLNQADLTALNTWAANKQPEFVLDSAFFFRNKESIIVSNSAAAATVNQALALKDAGGGILIGTDHNDFAYTANQILSNFGFDGLFTGSYNITPNASFVGNLLLNPEPVGSDFFTNNLQGLSTSYVPVGTHILNENGGNRTIQIYDQLYSYSPGKVVHIGASFRTDQPKSVPEPSFGLGLLAFGSFGVGSLLKRKQQQKVLNCVLTRSIGVRSPTSN